MGSPNLDFFLLTIPMISYNRFVILIVKYRWIGEYKYQSWWSDLRHSAVMLLDPMSLWLPVACQQYSCGWLNLWPGESMFDEIVCARTPSAKPQPQFTSDICAKSIKNMKTWTTDTVIMNTPKKVYGQRLAQNSPRVGWTRTGRVGSGRVTKTWPVDNSETA